MKKNLRKKPCLQCKKEFSKNNKNPLEDKKWLKEFSEGLKKDITKFGKEKKSSCGWVGEIICTQEDIGEPIYFAKESNKKTAKLLLQQVARYIKLGQIKIDEDSYEHAIGLSCQDYEFRFPDSWHFPQYYRIITDLNGELMKNKNWGKSKKKPYRLVSYNKNSNSK